MPNIAVVLKTEIARLARKEVRAQTQTLLKASVEQRKQITALKRQVAELQRALKKAQTLGRRFASESVPAAAHQDEAELRWRHEGFAAHRKRLGVSAQDMARLVGCSALSIYKWESGKVRPRRAQLQAIARVRALSKAAAQQELATDARARR
jgi:DNA-binding transcriptional regulator YiaG